MQKLFTSRKVKEEDAIERVPNISPDKYGKGAYYELTYTPSKLADHVLYREATNLKKIQEETSKSREFQAQHNTLTDQVGFLKRQRDGLTKSQNEIIEMYKTIISEMQTKNDDRIASIQKKFKQEMQKFIGDKEEEAKFFQSERQIFEEKILILQNQLNQTTEHLAQARNQINILAKDLEAQQNENKHLEQKFEEHVKRANEDSQRAKKQFDGLQKQFMHAEVEWKNTLNEQLHKKDKEADNLERIHRIELQKAEEIRKNEFILKNQEINELTRAFQAEAHRINDLLTQRERTIDSLSIQLNKQKTRSISLSKELESQTSKARFQKGKMGDQIAYLSKQNELLAKDKIYLTEDLQKQNGNLRDLLYESSNELDRCKMEIMDLAKENSNLLLRLKSSEDESRTWRDSYYLNKSRPY